MTRAEYNVFRGWDLPADENGGDEGYIVEYLDGGKANTKEYEGYISWSPKEQFDNAYRQTIGINFGLAIEAMKKGLRVSRHGWNGRNMFCFLVDGSTFKVNRAPLLGIYLEGTEINYMPHIDMCMADGRIMTWNASQFDMLSDDWFILPNKKSN